MRLRPARLKIQACSEAVGRRWTSTHILGSTIHTKEVPVQRSTRLMMTLPLLAGLAACQGSVPDLSAADKAAVQATLDKYAKAAVANDWDTWGTTLANDVFYSPPNLAPMTGRAAAVTWAKTFPKVVSLEPKVDEISGRGDLAYARGTYTLVVTMPDGSPMTDHGSFLEIHRKQADGSWPYTALEYHSTDPLPTPAATPPKPAKK